MMPCSELLVVGRSSFPTRCFTLCRLGPSCKRSGGTLTQQLACAIVTAAHSRFLRNWSATMENFTVMMIFFMAVITLRPSLTVESSLEMSYLCFLWMAHSFVEIKHRTVGC